MKYAQRAASYRYFSHLNIQRNTTFNVLNDKDVTFFESLIGKTAVITDENEL